MLLSRTLGNITSLRVTPLKGWQANCLSSFTLTRGVHSSKANSFNTTTRSSTLPLSRAANERSLDDQTHSSQLVKPFSEIPTVGNNLFERLKVWRDVHAADLKTYSDLQAKHGPIFRINFTKKIYFVVIGSADVLEDLFRHLGKWPRRLISQEVDAWYAYRREKCRENGLLQMEGEEWHINRSMINKRLQAMSEQPNWYETVQEVVTELLDRMKLERDPTTMAVTDLSELYKRMSMEVVFRIVTGSTLNSLKGQPTQETQEFTEAVRVNLELISALNNLATLHQRFNTKPWKEFVAANETLFTITGRFIRKHIDNESKENNFVEWLLSRPEINGSVEKIDGLLVDILMAGTDTTGGTLQFLTWHLGRNPDVQAKLYEEIEKVIGPVHEGTKPSLPSYEQLMRMPYTRGCMKEIMRLESVVPLSARVVPEECVIGGYRIPAMTQVVMHLALPMKDEKIFAEPEKFMPERWDRELEKRPNPYGSLPFLQGVRMCAGRRLAELEIMTAIVGLTQNFKFEAVDGAVPKVVYGGTRRIDGDIPVKVFDRW